MNTSIKHTLLIVPGLGDSGKEHWQNYWLTKYENSRKVIQNDWDRPILSDWLNKLNEAIAAIDGKIIIVAHSLAASLVAHWSTTNNTQKIAGALLVAPADVDSRSHTPEETWNFSPIPLAELDYPSIVVTSSNDPYISVKRAQFLAEQWGSAFINIGPKGHLNSDSQLEYWKEGQGILESLLTIIEAEKLSN
ncbi:RBBP9/YdeN family alpha/beta hydrolase [Flavobacterium sp. W22_SRS_FP1]|uniref:RBBP9/YdeN family alpha/beta hydrolase n=1 Tax=Flavobacterium sp. W22_SRS_FP1 TaxID=3240276 RepID=UPI003F912AB1